MGSAPPVTEVPVSSIGFPQGHGSTATHFAGSGRDFSLTYELALSYQSRGDIFFPTLRPAGERANKSVYGSVLDYDYADKFGNDLQLQMSNQRYRTPDRGEMVMTMENAVCVYVEKFSSDHVVVLKSLMAPVKTCFRHIVRWCGLRYKNIDESTVLAYPTPEMRIPEPAVRLANLIQDHSNINAAGQTGSGGHSAPPHQSHYNDHITHDHAPVYAPAAYGVRGDAPFRPQSFGYAPRGRGSTDNRNFRPAGGSGYRGNRPRSNYIGGGGGNFRYPGPSSFPPHHPVPPGVMTFTPQPYEGGPAEAGTQAPRGAVYEQHSTTGRVPPETNDAATTATPATVSAGTAASDAASTPCIDSIPCGSALSSNAPNDNAGSELPQAPSSADNGNIVYHNAGGLVVEQQQYEMAPPYSADAYCLGLTQAMSGLTIQTGVGPNGETFGPSPSFHTPSGNIRPPGPGLLYVADSSVQMYQQPGGGFQQLPGNYQQPTMQLTGYQQQQIQSQQGGYQQQLSAQPGGYQTSAGTVQQMMSIMTSAAYGPPPGSFPSQSNGGTMWTALPQESQSAQALAPSHCGSASTLNPTAAPFLHTPVPGGITPVPSGMTQLPAGMTPVPTGMTTAAGPLVAQQNPASTPMNPSAVFTYTTPPPPISMDSYGRSFPVQQMWMAPPPQPAGITNADFMQGARLVSPAAVMPQMYFGVRPSPASFVPAGMTPVGPTGMYSLPPPTIMTHDGMALSGTPQNVQFVPVHIGQQQPQLIYQPGTALDLHRIGQPISFLNGTQYVQLTPVQQFSTPYRNVTSRQNSSGTSRQSRY